MSDEDDDLDDIEMEGEEQEVEEVRLPPPTNLEARRRLEDRLEERRLNRMIQDYDFDFDDIA